MPRNRQLWMGWALNVLVVVLLGPRGLRAGEPTTQSPAESPQPVNLVRERGATVAVDSLFSGYGTAVLTDGKWIEKGKEITQEFTHRDRLGNGGNSWVSAESETEHWIRLDWPQPVNINRVEIWWSRAEWYPRAFRIERLQDGQWISLHGSEGWWTAVDQRSLVPLGPIEVRSLRIVQPPGGSGARSLMAAQEVSAFFREDSPPSASGARPLGPAEIRRLKNRELTRNLARLDSAGAASPTLWTADGREVPAQELADGNVQTAVALAIPVDGFGIRWPVEHVVDGLALVVAGQVPDAEAFVLEVHDGEKWVPIREGLRAERPPDQQRLVYAFEPRATRAVRARPAAGSKPPALTEIEVYRYLPPGKDVWPDHLVNRAGLSDRILAARDEPSFEALALHALSMTPARALLGLKDTPHEIGVTWDGTLMGREVLRFSFGEDQDSLADSRDTVRRQLIDGWRPGVVVEGQLGPLVVRQTSLVALVGGDPAQAALFVRIEVKNLGDRTVSTCLQAEAAGAPPPARFDSGALVCGDHVVLATLGAARPEPSKDVGGLLVPLTLEPGQQAAVDFIAPQASVAPGPALEPYRAASFDQALAWFRAYWDGLLSSAAQLDVPEARINRLVKAVLAQLFINGDGDIMRYGSEPSVYRQELYGVEESYAMLALALCGFGGDAQRYLDATYLTRDFLAKVETYQTYAHRHQQYRNGLQPHYAVSLYRLTRDQDWVRKHLPLLKECAEWTIRQRRRTMELENGQQPLHWGLLPKWSYGGDISDVQCYALYANYCCWRGLLDTAWLLDELGEPETARRYADEARDYRTSIDRAVGGSYQRDHQPPFLPLRLHATRPDEQMDYYQLFAGCILDLAPFEKGSQHFRWISDFLEQDNRVFCLLPRFRRDVGPGGLDALYGKGFLLAKLREDRVKEFLLGFYAFLAFNMDHETFASRETNALYASDLHLRSAYPVPDMSDPLPCSSAVALQLLRHMLVSEELAGPGERSGNLLLLPAVPRAWLRDGRRIRLAAWPTEFGPVSLEVRSATDTGRIGIALNCPQRNPYRTVKLRVRHPEARSIRSVTVDGQPWRDFDGAGEWILLPSREASYEISVGY